MTFVDRPIPHLPRDSAHSDPGFSELSRAGECPAVGWDRSQELVSGEHGCDRVRGLSVHIGDGGSLGGGLLEAGGSGVSGR